MGSTDGKSRYDDATLVFYHLLNALRDDFVPLLFLHLALNRNGALLVSVCKNGQSLREQSCVQ